MKNNSPKYGVLFVLLCFFVVGVVLLSVYVGRDDNDLTAPTHSDVNTPIYTPSVPEYTEPTEEDSDPNEPNDLVTEEPAITDKDRFNIYSEYVLDMSKIQEYMLAYISIYSQASYEYARDLLPLSESCREELFSSNTFSGTTPINSITGTQIIYCGVELTDTTQYSACGMVQLSYSNFSNSIENKELMVTFDLDGGVITDIRVLEYNKY